MQDYPQHLFAVKVLRSLNDPTSDFRAYYRTQLHITYSLFYGVTVLFSWLVPIEAAGKIALSLYVGLITGLVIRLHQGSRGAWGAILFYPLALNQQFFLGNVNFLLSLPLLIFALLDIRQFGRAEPTVWVFARQILWQIALVVAHPFTFEVYVGLAVIVAIVERRKATCLMLKVAVWTSATAVLLIIAWWESREPVAAGSDVLRWAPFGDTVNYLLNMFTGMQPPGSADVRVVAAWIGILLVVGTTMFAKSVLRSIRLQLLLVGVAVLAMFVLPYQIGDYTFINLRVASILYFLLALTATMVPLPGWRGMAVAVLAIACLVDASVREWHLSSELADIEPLIEKIPKNSRVLPLIFDRGSPELDRRMFNLNLHVHDYYYVAAGGGYDPYVPKSALFPVRYAPGQERPAPDEFAPELFDWDKSAADYQYFLTRAMPGGGEGYFASKGARVAVTSGPWELFHRGG